MRLIKPEYYATYFIKYLTKLIVRKYGEMGKYINWKEVVASRKMQS